MGKTIGYIVAGVAAFLLITWGAIHIGGFFSAESEGMRNKVFKQSQSYNDGMRNELNDLFLQYNKAKAANDTAGMMGIKSVTRDKFSAVDTTGYPEHLQSFLVETGAR